MVSEWGKLALPGLAILDYVSSREFDLSQFNEFFVIVDHPNGSPFAGVLRLLSIQKTVRASRI